MAGTLAGERVNSTREVGKEVLKLMTMKVV